MKQSITRESLSIATIIFICAALISSCGKESTLEPSKSEPEPYKIEKPNIDFKGEEFIGIWKSENVQINGKDLTAFATFHMRLNADSTATLIYSEENSFYNSSIRDTLKGYWTGSKERDKIFIYHNPVIASEKVEDSCPVESSGPCFSTVYWTSYTIDTFAIRGLSLGLGKDVLKLERSYRNNKHQYRLIR